LLQFRKTGEKGLTTRKGKEERNQAPVEQLCGKHYCLVVCFRFFNSVNLLNYIILMINKN